MKSFFKDYWELCKEGDKWMKKKTLERISGVMFHRFADLPRAWYRRAY